MDDELKIMFIIYPQMNTDKHGYFKADFICLCLCAREAGWLVFLGITFNSQPNLKFMCRGRMSEV